MSRTLHVLDQLACLLLGLLLLLAALLLVDWEYRLVLDVYPDTLHLGPVPGWTSATWWPWAVGGAGLLLVLIGLWWLSSHIPRARRSSVRLAGSDDRGRMDIDLASLAAALGRELAASCPVNDVSTTSDESGDQRLVIVRAEVDPRADGPGLIAAVGRITADVREAFPEGNVQARFLLHPPRPPGPFRRRARTHHVQ